MTIVTLYFWTGSEGVISAIAFGTLTVLFAFTIEINLRFAGHKIVSGLAAPRTTSKFTTVFSWTRRFKAYTANDALFLNCVHIIALLCFIF